MATMISENRANNVSSLDSLRAFAALSVCFYHFVCKTIDFIPKNWVYDFFFSGQYGVHLFFVISGFVIPWSMYHNKYQLRNFFQFLLKRLARLEPPYLVSVVLAILVVFARAHFIGDGQTHIAISTPQILLHVGYLIPFFEETYSWLTPVYWTLAVEFQYYFLIALLFVPMMKYGMIMRIIIYVSFGAISYLFGEKFLPHWLPIFLIGIALFLYKTKSIEKIEFALVVVAMMILAWDKCPHASLFFILLPVPVVLFASQLKVPVLHFLGKMSYSIYLIHAIIGIAVMNVLSHHVNGTFQKIGLVVFVMVISIFSSYIFYRIVEKPSKTLSSRMSYRK